MILFQDQILGVAQMASGLPHSATLVWTSVSQMISLLPTTAPVFQVSPLGEDGTP